MNEYQTMLMTMMIYIFSFSYFPINGQNKFQKRLYSVLFFSIIMYEHLSFFVGRNSLFNVFSDKKKSIDICFFIIYIIHFFFIWSTLCSCYGYIILSLLCHHQVLFVVLFDGRLKYVSLMTLFVLDLRCQDSSRATTNQSTLWK